MAVNQKVVAGTFAGAVAIAAGLIMHFEGQSNVAYYDPPKIATICFGHTKDVKITDKASDAQCVTFLREDLERSNATLDRLVKVPLTDNQRAAFLSLEFNIGAGKFAKSTALKKINAGDIKGACKELGKWIYSGGKVLPGLVRRRAAEMATCLS